MTAELPATSESCFDNCTSSRLNNAGFAGSARGATYFDGRAGALFNAGYSARSRSSDFFASRRFRSPGRGSLSRDFIAARSILRIGGVGTIIKITNTK